MGARQDPQGTWSAATGTATQAHEDPIDAFLRKQRDTTTLVAPAPSAPAVPAPPALKIPPRGIW